MAFIHSLCSLSSPTESPTTLVSRLVNSLWFLAKDAISVVQTGVKSHGCENSMAHLPLMWSWKLKSPAGFSLEPIRYLVDFEIIFGASEP
jgi:hypothetical protein